MPKPLPYRLQRVALPVLALLGLLGLAVPNTHAQELDLGGGPSIGLPTDYVTWSAQASPDVVSPGRAAVIRFDARIDGPGDWKMYALDQNMPDRTTGARPYGVVISAPGLPTGLTMRDRFGQSPPEEGYDVNFDLTLTYFHERASFSAIVDVDSSASAATGVVGFDARVRYQICSDDFGVCLRPETVTVPVALTIADAGTGRGASESALAAVMSDSPSETPFEDGEPFRVGTTDGLLAFLLLAVGAGLASLLTPCVFPMIPLTVSYFTKHADNRATSVRLAGAYGLAIIGTFTVIGAIMAAVFGAAGAQTIASNPWVNLFIAAVLVAFALSLLGLFELRLPSAFVNRAHALGERTGGIGGVLFMGLTLTLVSFSCTAPFVAGLLAAAAGGSWLFPIAGMIVYAATFAFPFVLFALFPNALQRLPRSGSWMQSVKVVLGFVELAAAVKFLSNADLVFGWGVLSRPLGIAFVVVVFLLAGMYLIGTLRLAHEAPRESGGVGRLVAGILFFMVALYMVPGLFGAPLNALDAYLPPRQSTDVGLFNALGGPAGEAVEGADEGWFVDDIDGAVAEATQRGVPILVDFTGYTCTNCRAMEANVFPRPAVAERLDRDFVRLKLYTDGPERGDEFHRYQLRLTGIVALPTYAVVAPDGETLIRRSFGMMDVDEFASFLDDGTARFHKAVNTRQG